MLFLVYWEGNNAGPSMVRRTEWISRKLFEHLGNAEYYYAALLSPECLRKCHIPWGGVCVQETHINRASSGNKPYWLWEWSHWMTGPTVASTQVTWRDIFPPRCPACTIRRLCCMPAFMKVWSKAARAWGLLWNPQRSAPDHVSLGLCQLIN